MARFKNTQDINVETVNNSRQELFKWNYLKTEIASAILGKQKLFQ